MNPEDLFSVPAARGVAELVEETLTALVPSAPAAKLTPIVCFLLAVGFTFLVAASGVDWRTTLELGIIDGLGATGLWAVGALSTGGKTQAPPPLTPK